MLKQTEEKVIEPEDRQTDWWWIVQMVSEGGIVISDPKGGFYRELVSKKWERVEALMDRWESCMAPGWEIIVNQVEANHVSIFTKEGGGS